MPAVTSLIDSHAQALIAACAKESPHREVHARHALNLARILRARGIPTPPTIRETAEALHDAALGVIDPANWRAATAVPVASDDISERLADIERVLLQVLAKGGVQ